ncbi:class I SAM-dependent methyltransferase [Nitrospinae bacterium AH_259_B05_G02_I21]|nr:class I SAM-dependent methyltransferase [Nitrospinae bacterium AH_259_B05_G02_I21]
MRHRTVAALDRGHADQCLTCRLVSFQVKKGASFPERYYDPIELGLFEEYYGPFRRRTFTRLVKEIQRFLQTGRVLDIGCSFGWFLEVAAKAGFEVLGLEPSKEVVAIARDKRGLNVREGDVASAEELPGLYDIILLANVLEHLPNPFDNLRRLQSRLAANGLLVVIVPNVDGLIHRLTYWAHWLSANKLTWPLEVLFQTDSPSMHLYQFSETAIRRALTKAGYRVVHVYGQEVVEIDALDLRQAVAHRMRRNRLADIFIQEGVRCAQLVGRWVGRYDELVLFATPQEPDDGRQDGHG